MSLVILVLIVLVANILIPRQRSYAQTDVFTTSGSWQVPAGVSSATMEAWGGGGAGGGATTNNLGGGGGAGGQYSIKNLAVTTNDTYTITVATTTAGGTGNGSSGGDSKATISSTDVVLAKGGAGGTANNGAGGVGSIANGVGDTIYKGGDGVTGSGNSGAGGGGAGSTGNGGNGSGQTGGSGTSVDGGNGGAGQTTSTNGGNGSTYGGAGGGGKKTTGANRSGGSGAAGKVAITYTVSNLSPAAPTLNAPASGATGVLLSPQFTLRTTDANNDYLRYKILLYQSNCSTIVSTIDQTSSQTGWSGQDTQTNTAYVGNSTITSSTMATYTYQSTLSLNTTYCWQAQAIDPGGSNAFGNLSATQSFTTNASPAAPTLSTPVDTATNVSTVPNFTLRSSDANNDYLRYKIELCSTSNCSTIVSTIDQTSSQTGWSGQDTQTNTAYVGNSTITSSTMATYTYQSTLSPSTTYWWRVYAIDPGGSNTFSGASSIFSFTTLTPPTSNTIIQGGTHIQGGTRIVQ